MQAGLLDLNGVGVIGSDLFMCRVKRDQQRSQPKSELRPVDVYTLQQNGVWRYVSVTEELSDYAGFKDSLYAHMLFCDHSQEETRSS